MAKLNKLYQSLALSVVLAVPMGRAVSAQPTAQILPEVSPPASPDVDVPAADPVAPDPVPSDPVGPALEPPGSDPIGPDVETPTPPPTVPVFQGPRLPRFSCGPQHKTYTVKPLDRRRGRGIRCVKWGRGTPNTAHIPRFAWYGEGNWDGTSYRHVGHAFLSRRPDLKARRFVGYAAELADDAETLPPHYPGTLKMRLIAAGRIEVMGAWHEEWIEFPLVNYEPLPRPQQCGQHFDQYQVSALDSQSANQGDGLRCVLRVGPRGTYLSNRYFTTWFGNGKWGDRTYSHIGTRGFSRQAGVSHICALQFGAICNTLKFGSLQLRPVSEGFNVTGAWNEKWR